MSDVRLRGVEETATVTESPQEQAVRYERNSTVRETTSLLRAGLKTEAYLRMLDGFDRQVRLSGLERIVREAMREGVTE